MLHANRKIGGLLLQSACRLGQDTEPLIGPVGSCVFMFIFVKYKKGILRSTTPTPNSYILHFTIHFKNLSDLAKQITFSAAGPVKKHSAKALIIL